MSVLHNLSDNAFWVHTKRVMGFVEENGKRLNVNMRWFRGKYKPAFLKFERALKESEDKETRTRLTVAYKNIARKEFEPLESQMELFLKVDPGITLEELLSLDIATQRGGGRHKKPPPNTAPEFFIRVKKEVVPGQLTLAYHDFGKKLEGRPRHVHHMEFEYGIFPEPVMDPKRFTERVINTNSPISIYEQEKRGWSVCGHGRWVSNAGEAGVWGEVVWFIIP
jgi:hypothetical protein